MRLINYNEGGREIMVSKLPNGQYAAVAWDPQRGEMYLPASPIMPADTQDAAQAALDAYAKNHNLQEYGL